ncbi:M23/M56 family metallopeptidase [Gilvimarinus algae]|uniref:M23/M56 family metallopeptidase n=1 Tax=Gilvimarinus algae TaxID=3058037 RepID=A0ABT8TAN1_9GAMM|nr:M23/M56 family metallopeptidase [Gilvimarinus sp. SDUM040014]MDO3381164.1 M23/M56 family metallopeptidase [Gilvimarinus sp. SDUM040014]
MSEQLVYLIGNSSFLLMGLAQRFLLFSIIGLILVILMVRLFKPRCAGPVWGIYLLWLVPASAPMAPSLSPGWWSHLGFSHIDWLDPCALLPVERVSAVPFSSMPFISREAVLIGAWLLVSLLLLARIVYRRLSFLRIAREAHVVSDPHWQTLVQRLRKDYRINRPVRLCSSSACATPFTIGLLRPEVFIPESMLSELDRETLEVVVAHELAHIARGDDLSVTFQHVFRALFFFNPLVNYAHRKLGEAREVGCDTLAVVRCRIAPRDYGIAMVRVLEHFKGNLGSSQPVAGFLNQDVRQRIQTLLHSENQGRDWLLPSALTVVLLLGVSLALSGAHQPSIMPEDEARALLAPLQAQPPIERARVTGELYLNAPLGCAIPHKDHYHSGMDFTPASTTAAVSAIAAGVVVEVMTPAGNVGKLVKIRHDNDIYSTYVRLDQVEVHAGQPVGNGQRLGSLGATERTDHLHFELHHGQQVIDPGLLIY